MSADHALQTDGPVTKKPCHARGVVVQHGSVRKTLQARYDRFHLEVITSEFA